MQIAMISWLIPIAVGCLLAPAAYGEPTPVNLLRQPGFKDCGENLCDGSFLARIFLSGIFSCPVFLPCMEFHSLPGNVLLPGIFSLSSFVCLISVRVFFSLSCVFLPWLYFFLPWNVFLPNIFSFIFYTCLAISLSFVLSDFGTCIFFLSGVFFPWFYFFLSWHVA